MPAGAKAPAAAVTNAECVEAAAGGVCLDGGELRRASGVATDGSLCAGVVGVADDGASLEAALD
eukprot:13525564-Alexandrium_andersonii.AAC.1